MKLKERVLLFSFIAMIISEFYPDKVNMYTKLENGCILSSKNARGWKSDSNFVFCELRVRFPRIPNQAGNYAKFLPKLSDFKVCYRVTLPIVYSLGQKIISYIVINKIGNRNIWEQNLLIMLFINCNYPISCSRARCNRWPVLKQSKADLEFRVFLLNVC